MPSSPKKIHSGEILYWKEDLQKKIVRGIKNIPRQYSLSFKHTKINISPVCARICAVTSVETSSTSFPTTQTKWLILTHYSPPGTIPCLPKTFFHSVLEMMGSSVEDSHLLPNYQITPCQRAGPSPQPNLPLPTRMIKQVSAVLYQRLSNCQALYVNYFTPP